MHWEELTGDQFLQAVAGAQGVCLLPLSCIERHAHHLPLGTDMYIGRELCRRAAELEPALIFPDFIFTQILEARHCPGTIAIEPDLILRLLDNVCREIARNGLSKIVIVNAHGGNNNLIHFFSQIQLAGSRDYVVYVAEAQLTPDEEEVVLGQLQCHFEVRSDEKSLESSLTLDLVGTKATLKGNFFPFTLHLNISCEGFLATARNDTFLKPLWS